MSLMSLGGAFDEFGGAFDEFGGAFDEFGRGLEQELGDECGGDLDEFDEFGGHFLVCLSEKGPRLMSLCVCV